jgi:hypothetical protein
MGLFEYLGERKNPGNVGDIEKNREPVEPAGIAMIIVKLIVSIIIIYGAFYFTVLQDFNIGRAIVFALITIVYCIISYHFVPRPDTSNMGLMGGLIDHPFRYSDDANRFLLVLAIVMYPGRFIATTIVQALMLIRRISCK